ncbi:MAG: TRAP transporter small permease subunit [Zetaproteobacteria bacterium]|nr:TRAP transporter small permease subunit [Zetaproteobacteria bacterium]
MKILKFYIKFVNTLNERIGFLVSWLTTAMVAVVCYDVFTRYLLKQSSVAVQEMEWHLFAVIFLLGAAYTLKHDRHVRVDIIYMRLSERQRAWINLLGTLLFLIPFSLLIIWSSKNFVINSFAIGESSPNPGGLPARYLLKACIPLGFILVLLQALSLVFSSLMVIVGRDDA